MDSRSISLFAALLTLAALTQELAADSYRCGRKLITVGDSVGKLMQACGAPFHKDRGSEKLRIDGTATQARVERWYYKQSSRKLEHIIVIHKGKVAAVQTGKR